MDFLGFETKKGAKGDYLPFASARAWVQQCKMKSWKEWKEWSKSGQRPGNIPGNPDQVYRGKGWVSWMDFLGFEGRAAHQKGDYLPFASARAWVRQRKIKSKKEWQEWSKSGQRPSNIPSHPDEVYRGKGWVSWMDFLGFETKKGAKGDYLPFESARAWVRQRKMKSWKEWQEWSKSGQRPSNIPSDPARVYQGKGWVSCMDFLGFEGRAAHQKGDYLPFASARAWVRQRKMKSKKEWNEWSKSGQRPSNIPSHPDEVYRGKGWVSYMDFLGFETKKGVKGDYLPFASARAWVRQRKMKSWKEWQEWSKSGQRPGNIPSNPNIVYRGKWVSWQDWLGTNNKRGGQSGSVLSFEDARAWVRQRKLKSWKEWQEWSKSGQRPSNIPSNPAREYRGKGWESYQDWMGYSFKSGDQNRKRKRTKQAEEPQQQSASSSSSSSTSSCSSFPPLENCAICFEPLCPVTTKIGHLACVHTFHVDCLAPLAHASAGPSTSSRRGVLLNCPLCRKRCRYLPEADEEDDGDDDE
eukprot:g1895.t1